jgi:head-tail adaptor
MSLLLSDAQIASMRTTLERTLPDTAVIQRPTQVSDGGGGYTETWPTVATVACRVAQPSGGEQVIADKLDAVGTWTITLPALTDVAAADKIMVGSRIFMVALPLRPRSWELSRRVLVTETL